MYPFGRRNILYFGFLIVCLATSLFPSNDFADSISINGVCNIIANGNNNIIYGDICSRASKPKPEIFDPPALWIGMDLASVRTLLGSRNPTEFEQNGIRVLEAGGRLFGLDGSAKYGFDADGRLAWMSVEGQCTEDRHDYTLTKMPPDLSPDWLQWQQTSGAKLAYGKLTACSQIENIPKILSKLFGDPTQDKSPGFNNGQLPNPSEICSITASASQPCSDTHAMRTTLYREFVGTDRVTGMGIEIRDLRISSTVQEGSYWPTIRRREMVGVVSVWGAGGRPAIEPAAYGTLRRYLDRELP
ncbi:hypothetical protein [Rhizobium leguminosarum]|uniref:Uncharacterized protein n=1 Tax=Rhizobium leguminosarum TaxID=384 RepID=A0A7K3VK17_RHILE|nr:hypothetical protein [Rhizobium leguminosarum]NEK17469.1 hypothetical protein [Rhizobium leguminosarum]